MSARSCLGNPYQPYNNAKTYKPNKQCIKVPGGSQVRTGCFFKVKAGFDVPTMGHSRLLNDENNEKLTFEVDFGQQWSTGRHCSINKMRKLHPQPSSQRARIGSPEGYPFFVGQAILFIHSTYEIC